MEPELEQPQTIEVHEKVSTSSSITTGRTTTSTSSPFTVATNDIPINSSISSDLRHSTTTPSMRSGATWSHHRRGRSPTTAVIDTTLVDVTRRIRRRTNEVILFRPHCVDVRFQQRCREHHLKKMNTEEDTGLGPTHLIHFLLFLLSMSFCPSIFNKLKTECQSPRPMIDLYWLICNWAT